MDFPLAITNHLSYAENDFLQQSEPTFMETTTTEINPETHERYHSIQKYIRI